MVAVGFKGFRPYRFVVSSPGLPDTDITIHARNRQAAEHKLRLHAVLQERKHLKIPCIVAAQTMPAALENRQKELDEITRGLCQLIDAMIPKEARLGFQLFVFEVDVDPGFISYIGNAERTGGMKLIEGWLKTAREAEEAEQAAGAAEGSA